MVWRPTPGPGYGRPDPTPAQLLDINWNGWAEGYWWDNDNYEWLHNHEGKVDVLPNAGVVHFSTAPDGSVLPLVYGDQRVVGQVVYTQNGFVTGIGNYGVFVVAICIGPVQAINSIYLNGQNIDSWITSGKLIVEKHLGAYDQASNYFVGQLPGCAYVELRFTATQYSYQAPWSVNFPKDPVFSFDVEGLITPNTITDVPEYSKNPANIIKDILIEREHGAGLPYAKVDPVTFTDAYNYYNTVDATYPDGHKFTINGQFGKIEPLQEFLNAFMLAANCRVYEADGLWKIYVEKAAGAVVHNFNTDTDCSNVQYSSLKAVDLPTRVNVTFINYAKPWVNGEPPLDTVVIEDPLVSAGVLPLREASYNLICVTQYKQALTVATKIYNQSFVSGRVSFDTTPVAVNLYVGDLITLTSSDGLALSPFIIQGITRNPAGFYSIQAQQYSTGMFSDTALTTDVPPLTDLVNPFDTPPDITPDGGSALYQSVYKESTGTTTINYGYAGTYYQVPTDYPFSARLIVRCAVGTTAHTDTWEDMIATERIVPLTGNAPLDVVTGHNTVIADALSVGTETFMYSGDTGALLNDTISYDKSSIIIRLENTYGIQSAGARINYVAVNSSTDSNLAVADVAEVQQYGAAYPNVFRLYWNAPRVVESEVHYTSGFWTLTGCGSADTSRINDGLTSLVAFDWNTSGIGRCDLDLGATAGNWKKFIAVRMVMNSTTFLTPPTLAFSDNGSSWTSVTPTYWQPYWSGTNIIGYTFEWPTTASAHRYWRFEKGSTNVLNMGFTELQWIATTGALVADTAILNTLVYAKAAKGTVTTTDPLIMSWPGTAPRPDYLTPVDFSNWAFSLGDGYEYLNLMFVEQCLGGNSTGKQVFVGGVLSRIGQSATTLAFGAIPASGNAALFLNGMGQFSAPPAGTVTTVSGTAPVVSSGGTTPAISMPAATAAVNGYMTSTYASKIDGIATGAQPGTVTSVGGTSPIASSGGNSPTISISAATTGAAGSMSAADKTKLDGVATGATANLGTVTSVGGTAPVVSSGGTTPAISMAAATASVNGYMSSVYAAKLDAIAAGAQPGTVTAIGVTTANGVSGSSSGGTTPNLTIALGAITPTSIAASGAITATGNITAYFSDERLKENIHVIGDALNKVNLISGVTYNANDLAASYGYTDKKEQVGVIAQQVQEVLPQVVVPAPFDTNADGNSKSGENYLTVQYEKLVPLLIEAIKELTAKVRDLEEHAKHRNGFGYNGNNGNGNGNGHI